MSHCQRPNKTPKRIVTETDTETETAASFKMNELNDERSERSEPNTLKSIELRSRRFVLDSDSLSQR